MSVRFLKNGEELSVFSSTESALIERLKNSVLDITLEWIEGQYWLHSDIKKERPIGIEIDKELSVHLEFFKKNSVQKELLARAIGIKTGPRPHVLDLTAGLLGDTLLFLSFGCHVTALERNPLIAFLIQSALLNAEHPLIENLNFQATDAKTYLGLCESAEVIYYDPMYEDANHKASPRKEMRIFRSMVGKDTDGEEVLRLAREKNPKRIVVKRPKHSAPIGMKAPLEYLGKATRYDVYLGQNTRTFALNPVK